MRRASFAIIGLTCLVASACGGSLTGNWTGTEAGVENTSQVYAGTLAVQLTESSGNLTGSFTSTPATQGLTARTGTITGTVSGDSVTLTVVFTAGCTGLVTGTGTKKDDYIVVNSLKGTTTGCGERTTSWTLVR